MYYKVYFLIQGYKQEVPPYTRLALETLQYPLVP